MIHRCLLHVCFVVIGLMGPLAQAHRIDSLSATADFSADGREMSLEVSAEAVRILGRTEGLSMLPRFQAGGAATEEVA